MLYYGEIELKNMYGKKFKVNGQRVKHYMGESDNPRFICEVDLKSA